MPNDMATKKQDTTSEAFMNSNKAFYMAKLSGAMHGLIGNYPEAGHYLLERIKTTMETKQDAPLKEPVLRDRIMQAGLIDPSSQTLRLVHAVTLNEAFEMEDATRTRIFEIHNPQEQQGNQSGSPADAVSTTYAQRVGFDLQKLN